MPTAGDGDLFINQVRRALQHLYDPVELSHSPLQKVLPLDPTLDRVTALRKVLQEAVQALKPEENVPPDSNAWRIHDVLSYRYIEQSSQREVAADMALSTRQLQRLETTALQVLCETLIARYKLDLPPSGSTTPAEESATAPAAPEPGAPVMAVDQEYDWLKKSSRAEEIDLADLVESTLATVAPMIQALGAEVLVEIPPALPGIHGQRTILRQALINLLTAALHQARQGRLYLSAAAGMRKVRVQFRSVPAVAAQPEAELPDVAEILAVARQLVEISGGTLHIQMPGDGEPAAFGPGAFEAVLIFPAAQRVTVLVIDDNHDTLLLLERYLSGSHYAFTSGRDPAQLFALVEAHHPEIIVLDVMLPGIDGWDLLGRVKTDPATRAIPVIISTILPQESLALMLGANAFLRKPFTREQLVETLDKIENANFT